MSNESAVASPLAGKKRSSRFSKLGIGLMLMSGVFFFAMLSVPWWPIGAGAKAIAGGGLFVSVQASWWIGAAMAGPAAVKALVAFFRRRKPDAA